MAAGGSLAPAGLLWLCLAPAALLRLRQPQPVLVVKPGEPVGISCELSEAVEAKSGVAWYRRVEDRPELLLDCRKGTEGDFSCEFRRPSVTLRIASAQPQHSGLYFCAQRHVHRRDFSSSTTLLVGDSWRNGSWVRVLAPHGDPQAPPGLVCAVGAATGPVTVSWQGGAGEVLGLGNSPELLLSPVGSAGGAGGLCEVQFNSSGPPVRRSVELHVATGNCVTSGLWVLAGAVVLLLLSLCLSTRCLRRRTPTGEEPGRGGGRRPTVSPLSPVSCPPPSAPSVPNSSIPDPPPSLPVLPHHPSSCSIPSVPPTPGTRLPPLSPPGHQPGTPLSPVSRQEEVRPCSPPCPPQGSSLCSGPSVVRGRRQPRCCRTGELGVRGGPDGTVPAGTADVRPAGLHKAHAVTRSCTW
ncbi:uncharacterized protein LOC141971454 [Athene noctua]|uniref:uncharacterized protein LOC141971454 n=1 Tax=Athene noctua TaxID=126797 RepID=UPI003EBD3114